MPDLGYQFEQWKVRRGELLQEFNELWDDDEALNDTLEGETGLTVEALVDVMAENILKAEALAAGAKQRAKDMAARANRLIDRVDSSRGLLIQLLSITDTKKITTPTATVTLKPTPKSLLILEEADIASEYWNDSDPVLDKARLKADLKEGKEVEGAILSEPGSTVAIRPS